MHSDEDRGRAGHPANGTNDAWAPESVRHVHLVGIGGIGMLALAQYLVARGISVSGSDLRDSAALTALRSSGVRVHTGHSSANVADADLVVVTSAARETNPEIVEAAKRGIPVVKRALLLGRITDSTSTLAVAGTHGKTTTTALTGHLLRTAGVDASVLGGGFLRDRLGHTAGPALIGSASSFVVEADEYDRSFLHLHPAIAVITGIEFDHPDCYADIEEMTTAYRQFARQVTSALIVSGHSSTAVAAARDSGVPVETFGIEGAYDWTASEIDECETLASFCVHHGSRNMGRFRIPLRGRHNVSNGLAALAAACRFSSLPARAFQEGLASFPGVARRLEQRGHVAGITVIDDYAHHPTEIATSLTALGTTDNRLRLIFQPHTFSRTAALFDEFVEALSGAGEVILLNIYAARENPIAGVDSERLAEALRAKGRMARHFEARSDAVHHAVAGARAGDVIITMGAGDVGELSHEILQQLEGRGDPEQRFAGLGAIPSRTHAATHAAAGAHIDILKALEATGLTRVRADEPMVRHTSWRIGGAADFLGVAETPDAVGRAMRLSEDLRIPCLVIGGGSNILVSDQGIEGLVILNRIRTLRVTVRCETHHPSTANAAVPGMDSIVEAGSGVFFARLALYSARHGYTGLEWGVAIPGTVGAGVVNNAGAHHGDVQQALVRAEAIDPHGNVAIVDPANLEFRYRQSALKRTDGAPITRSESVITRCWFRTMRGGTTKSLALIDDLVSRRRATQPIAEPSAGSTFKNPEGGSAGEFIERAGLKGAAIGDACFSLKHANFIVNSGHASAADVAALIRLARSTVRQQFGIELEPEVQVVGRWSDPRPLFVEPNPANR